MPPKQDAVRVFKRPARAELQPFIRRFLVVEFAVDHNDSHFPDIGAVAAFSFRGDCRLDSGRTAPPAAITGLHERLRNHAHRKGHAVLLAKFTPAGAAAFLQPPLDAFAGRTEDLTGVLARPEELETLHQQVAAAPGHAYRIGLLEDFLLARLRMAAPDPVVAAAVALLERGGLRIAALAQQMSVSQSALERRFQRILGVSPKKFASLVRFGRALRLRAGGASFTAAAHGAGYFDQSHFIHAFRRVTGTAPETYFGARRS